MKKNQLQNLREEIEMAQREKRSQQRSSGSRSRQTSSEKRQLRSQKVSKDESRLFGENDNPLMAKGRKEAQTEIVEHMVEPDL